MSGDGLVTWRPPDALAGTTNEVSVWVLDNGLPAMGATQSFNVVVVSRPILAAPTFTNGEVALSWSAIPGTSYRLQFTPVLDPAVWTDLAGDVTASGTNAAKADSITPDITNRVYRVQVLP